VQQYSESPVADVGAIVGLLVDIGGFVGEVTGGDVVGLLVATGSTPVIDQIISVS